MTGETGSIKQRRGAQLKLLLALSLSLLFLGLWASAPLAATGYKFPDLPDADYVSDEVGVLDESCRQSVREVNRALAPSGAQIVVAVVNEIGEAPLEDYANELLRHWGIGSAEKNNGVLLLIVYQENQIRIEVGTGLEGALPDGRAGEIIRKTLAPHFREGDFSGGVTAAVRQIGGIAAEEYGIDLEAAGIEVPPEEDGGSSWQLGLFLLVMIVLFSSVRPLRRSLFWLLRSLVWGSGSGGSGSGGSSSGGGFGGGSFGGGGFSGGGGSSSGGGASGGW